MISTSLLFFINHSNTGRIGCIISRDRRGSPEHILASVQHVVRINVWLYCWPPSGASSNVRNAGMTPCRIIWSRPFVNPVAILPKAHIDSFFTRTEALYTCWIKIWTVFSLMRASEHISGPAATLITIHAASNCILGSADVKYSITRASSGDCANSITLSSSIILLKRRNWSTMFILRRFAVRGTGCLRIPSSVDFLLVARSDMYVLWIYIYTSKI